VTAGAVWDAVHLAAGELYLCGDAYAVQRHLAEVQRAGLDLLQQRGPVLADALHANTVINALHHAFRVSGEPATRLLILLQAVGWLFHFRENLADKKGLGEPRDITQITGAEIPH
jgi:hypothetical protein